MANGNNKSLIWVNINMGGHMLRSLLTLDLVGSATIITICYVIIVPHS